MAGPQFGRNPAGGFFSMGQGTLEVPMALFAENRARLAKELRSKSNVPANSMVLLQGGSDQGVCKGDSSDVGNVFRQESFFHWAFGVLEPDYYGAVVVETGKSALFMPKLPEDYAIWMGKVKSTQDVKEMYGVDAVYYVEDLKAVLLSGEVGGPGTPTLLTLNGVNSDSKKPVFTAAFDGISDFKTDGTDLLHRTMSELRVIKTAKELDVLRYVCRVSSGAHMEVMRKIRPGMKEYQSEANFLHHVYHEGGCRRVCYTCICGSGSRGAVLHYGHAGAPNDLEVEDGDMVLFDMGAEYYCFCSDITCSYPANGKFTEDQKLVYNAVLRANRAVVAAAKPGVSWVDMHLLANRTLLEDLKAGGLLRGEVDDMMAHNLGGYFQPHGLGHFMGLDVHDVGGYLEGHPARGQGLGLQNLRTSRVLKENMVLTIEPGCYFIDHLLQKAKADKKLSEFIVWEKLDAFRKFGGVRIEDDVIITKQGAEIMSVVPRTVEDIEAWMAGEDVKIN